MSFTIKSCVGAVTDTSRSAPTTYHTKGIAWRSIGAYTLGKLRRYRRCSNGGRPPGPPLQTGGGVERTKFRTGETRGDENIHRKEKSQMRKTRCYSVRSQCYWWHLLVVEQPTRFRERVDTIAE
jgi:hypothetical protein